MKPSSAQQITLEDFKAHFQKNQQKILSDYQTFLRFESVSTDPTFQPQVMACAQWLVQYLKNIGMETTLWPTSGYPTIFATHLQAGPEAPTVLIYHHYDVQPVDPLELWETPPFEPSIRNGQVYARGAQDNKGQCLYTLHAIQALLQLGGKLPVNLKLCIEGEEEKGSGGLSGILKERAKELKADFLVIVDSGIHNMQTPAVTLGARGIVTMDVELQGSRTDLHSGSHGGIAYNPLHALVEMLAKLHDPQTGEVAIPGFYDNVQPLDEKEKKQLSLNFNESEYQKEFGIPATGGEKKYSPHERTWSRPTVEINGLSGGYSGPGFKTVIPAKASAKVSCRLVPNQDPMKTAKLVEQFLQANTPKGIVLKTHIHPGVGPAVRARIDSAVVKSFAQAYQEVFEKPCGYIFIGGSIPVVAELVQVSKSEVVLMGLGLPGDCIHAPNEHFGIDRIEKGFLIMCRALQLLKE